MRLSPEVVLSIHRILDHAQDTSDALGTLDGDFDPVATLNELIPNGLPVAMFEARVALHVLTIHVRRGSSRTIGCYAE